MSNLVNMHEVSFLAQVLQVHVHRDLLAVLQWSILHAKPIHKCRKRKRMEVSAQVQYHVCLGCELVCLHVQCVSVCVPVCVHTHACPYVCACEHAIYVHHTHTHTHTEREREREREREGEGERDPNGGSNRSLTVVNYNQIISDNGVISLPQKQNCSKKLSEAGPYFY